MQKLPAVVFANYTAFRTVVVTGGRRTAIDAKRRRWKRKSWQNHFETESWGSGGKYPAADIVPTLFAPKMILPVMILSSRAALAAKPASAVENTGYNPILP